MIHKEFILHSREGEKLRGDLRYEPSGKKKPAIIFLHGFKGFKNWGPFPFVCEQIASHGFISIAFNFSHNGIGEDFLNFTELDRFA
jgi:dienelactone hydrolase